MQIQTQLVPLAVQLGCLQKKGVSDIDSDIDFLQLALSTRRPHLPIYADFSGV